MKRYWPAAVAIAVYWTAVAVAVMAAARLNDGRVIYPLDDSYIHMAIAKNVALHHVWGVTRYAFDSSTSSPLWTLLLSAIYLVAGVRVAAPLALNLVAGTLIVLTLDAVLRARAAAAPLRLLVLMVTVWIMPLPALTVLGMEHTLHAVATLWFAFAAASLAASDRPAAAASLARLGALAAIMVALRYEGLFTLAVVALLLLATRGPAAAAMVTAIGAAPAAIYGGWSMVHGWYPLPNSLLLKGTIPAPSAAAWLSFVAGVPAVHNLIANPHLLILLVAALTLLVVVTAAPIWGSDVYLLLILIGTLVLHLQLARVGWFYRYEAYLLALGAAVLGAIAAERLPRRAMRQPGAALQSAAAAALIVVAAVPFVSRGVNAWRNTPAAASNIYQQQYQMGLFLDRFYRGHSVAVNDIGAVAFLADVRLLDIYGLASLDVLRLRRARAYDAATIAAMAARASSDVAVIYPGWMSEYGGVPGAWQKVGEWTVRDNVVLGASSVGFYAIRESERAPLTEHLRQFAASLPAPVMQTVSLR